MAKVRRFKIPVKYTVLEFVDGYGEDLEEAIKNVKKNLHTIPLLDDPELYDDDVCVDDGEDGDATSERALNYIENHYNRNGQLEVFE